MSDLHQMAETLDTLDQEEIESLARYLKGVVEFVGIPIAPFERIPAIEPQRRDAIRRAHDEKIRDVTEEAARIFAAEKTDETILIE